MIVGTAGHIDHGKTALVQALTGVNTDRLPEEKRRGITIELGYAFMDMPGGERIGFVDAPGHERLVRTMVAGASGIDYALLLMAADDGPKPQTLEHLSVLQLLGIRHGAAVITKIDRVAPEQVRQREQQARALLGEHGLDDYTVLATSAQRGDGIDALRDLLRAQAMQSEPRQQSARQADGQGFRMALDRVFTLEGVGTVVAGSVAAGSVAVGDHLVLAHRPDVPWRVRSLHAQNRPVQEAHAGQRCAIGLAGLERGDAERGQALCDPAVARVGDRFDVWLQVAASEPRALRSGTPVHLHLGTQDVMASVAVLGAPAIAPGEAALAQIITRENIAAWHGDRLVLRDASATRTVAGGHVLDPNGLARYRQTPERLATLQSQQQPDATDRLHGALAHAPLGIDAGRWLQGQGLSRWPFDVATLPGVVFDAGTRWAISRERLDALGERVVAVLRDFHAKHPDDIGPDLSRARRLTVARMSEVLWRNLVEALAARGLIVQRNGFMCLPSHGVQLREAERIVAQRALPMLEQGGFDPPWVRDISATARLPEAQVRAVLARLARSGEAYQIVKDLYYHPRQVARLASLAREVEARDGQITAALFRDACGIGRKRAVQILEFFDRIGFLRRVGDAHLIRPGTPLFPPRADARRT